MKDVKLIGVAGASGSGKDVVSDILVRLLKSRKLSFAYPIKNMLRAGLGMTSDQLHSQDKSIVDKIYNVSTRDMLQTLGTDWGRKYVGEDVWIKALQRYIEDSCMYSAVISDVRFENEAEWIREHGTLICLQGRGGIGTSHKSEQGIKSLSCDINVTNDISLEELEEYLKILVLGNCI